MTALKLALLLACAPLVSFATADAQMAPAPAKATNWTKTEALAESYVTSGKAPGIVIAIGRGAEPATFISEGRVGTEATHRAVDPDTLWRVYSMTKPVTAMAAMILIDDGKLKLDDPVSKYIPAFKDMKVLTAPDASLDSRPAARPVTIRHLMTHTAGLGYNIITKGPLLKEYERLGILPAAVNLSMEGTMGKARAPDLKTFADRTGTLPLIADPGTKWSYSIGLDVLGRVIEVAGGMPFDAFVQTRIFDPLKMTHSYWTVPGDQLGNFVTNYTFIGERLIPLDPANASVYAQKPSFPYGGAGLVMSARDYDRFLTMLLGKGELDGVRVLKPETVALAMSNLLPEGVNFGGVGQGTGGSPIAGGFGAGGSVYLTDLPGGGPKAGTYGWGGAAGTIGFVDPKSDLRVTVMVNYFPGEKWPLRQESVAAIYTDLATAK